MKAETLQEKIKNSKPVHFSKIFSKSIELFKKIWTDGIVHVLIGIAIMISIASLMNVLMFGITLMSGVETNALGQHELPLDEFPIAIQLMLIPVFIVILLLLVAAQFGINAHFYRICKQIDHGLPKQSSYFMYFKGRHIKKLLGLSAIIVGIFILSIILFSIPILYFLVPIQLIMVIFAFHPELSVSEIVKSSFALGNKLWFTAFGLIILSSILAQTVGLAMCCIGIIGTVSFVYVPIYYLYKDAIGFDDGNLNTKSDEISVIAPQ